MRQKLDVRVHVDGQRLLQKLLVFVETPGGMPIDNRFFRIMLEKRVGRATRQRNPRRFKSRHQVDAFGWFGQWRVDRGGPGIDRLRVIGIGKPKSGTAFRTKMAARIR